MINELLQKVHKSTEIRIMHTLTTLPKICLSPLSIRVSACGGQICFQGSREANQFLSESTPFRWGSFYRRVDRMSKCCLLCKTGVKPSCMCTLSIIQRLDRFHGVDRAAKKITALKRYTQKLLINLKDTKLLPSRFFLSEIT